MRARLHGSLIVLAVLAVMVLALGALQYRWLGQVSEAEREQLRSSIDRRARDFTSDFDRELGALRRAVRTSLELGDGAKDLRDGLAGWRRTARFPSLVLAVYEAYREPLSLHRLDEQAAAFEPVEWPADLLPVRDRLTPARVETVVNGDRSFTKLVAIDLPSAFASVPALLLWQPMPLTRALDVAHSRRPVDATRSDLLARLPLAERIVIVHLNRAYITREVMPALASRHFAADDVRLEIVDAEGHAQWSHGLAGAMTIQPETADVTLPFFEPRGDVEDGDSMRGGVFTLTGAALPADAGRVAIQVERQDLRSDIRIRTGPEHWQLLVQHPAGSLDIAVARARRRNAWLSFGILAVLTISIALVLRNARRAQQLAAQQLDFVAAVSHELRTPVAVIRSAAQNLSAGIVQAPDQARRYGEVIDGEGRRLTDMVEQVLEYAGIDASRDPSRWSQIDVAAIARDVADSCAPLAHDGEVRIDVDAEPNLPRLTGDERGVRRALENLVTNAVRHAADGRWVGITIRHVTKGHAGWVRIEVADRGEGITSEDLPHVFEPFYRGRRALDRQVPGSGLGLSLVKRFATLAGGRVAVASAAREGTTFTLELPLHRHERRSPLQVRHA